MDKEIQKLLESIGETIKEFIENELILINLKDSEIINNVNYTIKDNIINIELPEYYKYIESGRQPFVKKVPISILLKWMKRKGISTENNRVWAIQMSIYKNGIKARPFLKSALESSEKEVNELLAFDFSTIIDNKLNKIMAN